MTVNSKSICYLYFSYFKLIEYFALTINRCVAIQTAGGSVVLL